MDTKVQLEQLLIKWEVGNTPLRTICTVGRELGLDKLVVGIGHDVTEEDALEYGDKILLARVAQLFEQDVEKAMAEAVRILPTIAEYPLEVQLVLPAMCFQMGEHGVRSFKKFLHHLGNKNYYEASQEMLHSQWARETPHRARAMAQLIAGARRSRQ